MSYTCKGGMFAFPDIGNLVCLFVLIWVLFHLFFVVVVWCLGVVCFGLGFLFNSNMERSL